jgi:hypothetical protein
MRTITLKRVHGTAILGCRGQIVRNEETPLLCLAMGLHERGAVLDLSQTTAIDQWGPSSHFASSRWYFPDAEESECANIESAPAPPCEVNL